MLKHRGVSLQRPLIGCLAILVLAIGILSGCGGSGGSDGPTDTGQFLSPTTPRETDTTPPSTPTGLSAVAASPSQINLSWNASTDNVGVTGYRIFRDGSLIATVGTVTTYQNTGLAGSTTYSYTVRAFDAAGNNSAQSPAVSATTPAVPDTIPPSVPTGLSAITVSPFQINLNWNASTDNVGVAGYRVYRNGTFLINVGNVTSYQDTGLTASTSYSYSVDAVDGAGNASTQSVSVSATTQSIDTTAPSTPSGLTATAVSTTRIDLAWNAATDNVGVTGYRVFRGGTLLATLGNVVSYQDTALLPSTTYTYTVRAFDAAGNVSVESAPASATTLAAPDTSPPSTPTGLTAAAISSSRIDLSWSPSTDNVGVTNYRIYRGGVLLATVGNVTTYSNTNLSASTTYSYTVQALDAAGNASGQSSPVSATTLAAPDTTPPSIPTGLSATAISSSRIDISWNASTDNVGVTGYRVYRDGVFLVSVSGTTTSYQNTGLSASTTYSYRVDAIDGAGNASGLSSPATATTLSPDDPGTISISLVAGRTSGVAPLSVFFDASGTTAAGVSKPFHDLEYRWNFGDPSSGNWRPTDGTSIGRSRNSATGPLAVHVFDPQPADFAGQTEKTYTVSLTVLNGSATATREIQIVVQNPDITFSGTNTIVVSTSGNFTGKPVGALEVTSSSFDAVIAAHAGAGKRILFRRGETFNVSNTRNIPGGPSILGAFGTGDRPIIRATSSVNIVRFARGATDVRIVDLDMFGNGHGSPIVSGPEFTNSIGITAQILFLRSKIRNNNTGSGVVFYASEDDPVTDGAFPWDQLAFVDCDVLSFGSYGMFVSAQRLAILGTHLLGVQDAHVTRFPYIKKSIISNSIFGDGATGMHLIKLASQLFSASGTYNEQFVISDNKFDGNRTGWPVTIGPQNGGRDERVREFIVERNWFMSSASSSNASYQHLTLWASRASVRNNIFDSTRGSTTESTHYGVVIDRRGVEPIPDDIQVYNNTGHKGDPISSYVMVRIVRGTNMIVRNNLASAPRASSSTVLSNSGTSTVQSNNLATSTPGWTSSTPTAPLDFSLSSTSIAVDAGVSVPVFSDFARTNRPQNGLFDLGAWERIP